MTHERVKPRTEARLDGDRSQVPSLSPLVSERILKKGRGWVISGHKVGHRPVAGPPSAVTTSHRARWPENSKRCKWRWQVADKRWSRWLTRLGRLGFLVSDKRLWDSWVCDGFSNWAISLGVGIWLSLIGLVCTWAKIGPQQHFMEEAHFFESIKKMSHVP
ncbi:uncharacterized protein [Gossypium hirsutum]|uniref:Uncharacterized protein n=1 Tax=Gossypium hirsutum TaxID=3635 RepID=A0ABM3A9S2_GOSHI|nr:uncharacterized protein LOC121218448 [Gossypium hirsutum]